MLVTAEKDLWYIIKNGDIIRFGELSEGSTLENIKPIMVYYNKSKWEEELKKLDKDPNDGFSIIKPIEEPIIKDPADDLIKPIEPVSIFDILEKSKLKR